MGKSAKKRYEETRARLELTPAFWEPLLKKLGLIADRAAPGFDAGARPGLSTRTNQLQEMELELRTVESDLGARAIRQFLVELAAAAVERSSEITLSRAWQREIAITCLIADILCTQHELDARQRDEIKTAIAEEALQKTYAAHFPMDPRLIDVALTPGIGPECGSAEELKRRWEHSEIEVRNWKAMDLPWPGPGLADGVAALACLRSDMGKTFCCRVPDRCAAGSSSE